MDNAEEIMHFLEVFSKRKSKTIPPELNDYLSYVARTGDPVFQWGLVKSFFKEKLLCVLTDFYENSPGIDIPPYPNVDPFNYDSMKNGLMERLDTFLSAPFTLQRICELLINPRKQYNRIDKFMRAIEKNILVVSTREPGAQFIEQDNGESAEAIHNGSDNNSDYNVDVEMEEVSWKESKDKQFEAQPSSSDHRKSDEDDSYDDSKSPAGNESQDDQVAEYESVTPPDDSANDENDVQESDSTEEDKGDDSSSSSDEVIPKLADVENCKDEEGKPFGIPKILSHMETDQKECIIGVGGKTVANKHSDEIANNEETEVLNHDDNNEATQVVNDDDVNDVKTQVVDIETENELPSDDVAQPDDSPPSDVVSPNNDVSPSDNVSPTDDKLDEDNIEDVSHEDDNVNNKLPELTINDNKITVEKVDIHIEVITESTIENGENNGAIKIIDKVPDSMECDVKNNEPSPKSPNITLSGDYSPTKSDSNGIIVPAVSKDNQHLAKGDQKVIEDKQHIIKKKALADDNKILAEDTIVAKNDQCQDLPAE